MVHDHAMREDAPPPSASRRELEISALCQSCGLCCDGTMYSRAQIEPEMSAARRRRLNVLPDQEWLTIPCEHLEKTRCGVYEDRPAKCRTYECKQVRDHRFDGGPLQGRLDVVLAIKELSQRLRAGASTEQTRSRWTHWGLYDLLERGDGSVPPDVALDLVELAVRIQRDLGWAPDPASAHGSADVSDPP